jgi:hypothetical protein
MIEDELEFPRDRDKDIAERPLDPLSLVGSYFRGRNDDGFDYEGLVVGQPFATTTTSYYLVEFFGKRGALGFQMLKTIDEMIGNGWTFFDTEAWLSASVEQVRVEPTASE